MTFRPSRRETPATSATIERRVHERTADLERELVTLRTLVDTLPLALWLKDRAGRYLAVNKAHAHACGLTIAQMIGRSDDDLCSDEISRSLRTADLAVIEGAQSQRVKLAYPGQDGEARWREVDTHPVIDENGAVSGTAGIAREITEHCRQKAESDETAASLREWDEQLQTGRQALLQRIDQQCAELSAGNRLPSAEGEALRQQERRVQQAKDHVDNVINAVPDLLVELDGEGRYHNVWAKDAELLAEYKTARLGKTVRQALSPQAAESVMSSLREAAQNGYSLGNVYNLTLPSGERWFEVSMVRKPARGSAPPTFIAISRDISERRRAEEIALRRERDARDQCLSNIAENLPGFLYIFRRSPDGVLSYPYVSPGVRDLCGLEPDALAQSAAPLVALIRAEELPSAREKFAISVRDMSLLEVSITLDLPGGERFLASRARPRQDADGSILWYGVMLDVSEQRRLENRLNLSRFALDRVREGFLVHGDDLRLVYVNEEACRTLAYSRDELLALSMLDIAPLLTPEREAWITRKVTAEGRCLFESRLRRRDGSELPVEVNTSVFEYRGQSFHVSLVRDLTEQKRAEEVIAAREREFRTLAHSLPDKLARYDRDGVATYINAELYRQLGAAAATIVGKRVREWCSDGSYDVYARTLDAVLATGQEREFELFFPDPRIASDQVHLIRMVAERDEDGAIVGALAIGRDISALKRSERALEDSRSQLRGLIARSDDVREAERKRIAREVHDELGQILTGLQMNVSRLARNAALHSPQLIEAVRETQKLAENALTVARNVARSLRPAVLDMGIVAALEWLAGRFTANTGIQCHADRLDDSIEIAESQAVALFRIAQESLTNVARHARASRCDISLEQLAGNCILKVSDNGVGFDEHDRKDATFGLLGIRERAFILGGTVRIDSGLGNGAQITVTVPRRGIEGRS